MLTPSAAAPAPAPGGRGRPGGSAAPGQDPDRSTPGPGPPAPASGPGHRWRTPGRHVGSARHSRSTCGAPPASSTDSEGGPKPHQEAALGPEPTLDRVDVGAQQQPAGSEVVHPSGPLAGVYRGLSV